MSTAFSHLASSGELASQSASTVRFPVATSPPPAGPAGILVVLVSASRNERDGVAQELQDQGYRLQAGDLDDATAAPAAVRDLYAVLRRRLNGVGQPTALLLSDGAGPARLKAATSIVAFDEFVLHLGRREVRVDDQLVELTKTEFDLLHVLVREPGIVFSREQIVTAYKGQDYPVTMRSVDVQIFGLRRKLGRAGTRLQTIRGVGYRFLDGPLPPSKPLPRGLRNLDSLATRRPHAK